MSNLPSEQVEPRIRAPRKIVGNQIFRAVCLTLFSALIPVVSGVYAQESETPNRSRSNPSGSPTKTDPPKSEKQLAEERKARDAARKRGEITFDDLKFDIEK